MTARLSIGQAWADAAAFLRRERHLLVPVVLGLIAVPAIVLDMIQPTAPPGELPDLGALWILVLLMLLVMLVGQLVVALLAGGSSDSPGDAIRRAVRRLPILILSGLIIIVPILALSMAAGALGVVAKTGGGVAAADAGKAGIALILLLILTCAMIYVAIRMVPLFVVVARGNDGALGALKRTFRLTRGRFWKLAAFALLITIGFLVLAAAVGAVVGSLVTVAIGPAEPWTVSRLLIATVSGLLQAAFVAVYTSMIASITLQLERGAPPTEGAVSGT